MLGIVVMYFMKIISFDSHNIQMKYILLFTF